MSSSTSFTSGRNATWFLFHDGIREEIDTLPPPDLNLCIHDGVCEVSVGRNGIFCPVKIYVLNHDKETFSLASPQSLQAEHAGSLVTNRFNVPGVVFVNENDRIAYTADRDVANALYNLIQWRTATKVGGQKTLN